MFFIGKTDVGKRRANNQDCFDITELDGGAVLCTVCDGMGGANGGNVASDIASRVYVSNVKHYLGTDTDENVMKNAVTLANSAVYEASNSDESLKGMGTTLVSALIHDHGQITVINVGDSRLYYILNGDIVQITHDHSYVQYLVDMGQITITEAKNAPIRNIIIRSIGNEEHTSADVFNIEYDKNGYLLLCTDGLSNFINNEQILKLVKNVVTKEDADKCTDKLVKLANDAGGTDNITVILIKL
jgi:protein phosphatase